MASQYLWFSIPEIPDAGLIGVFSPAALVLLTDIAVSFFGYSGMRNLVKVRETRFKKYVSNVISQLTESRPILTQIKCPFF
jgi:hypothetical protein